MTITIWRIGKQERKTGGKKRWRKTKRVDERRGILITNLHEDELNPDISR